MSTEFVYRPLNKGVPEIRLLELMPAVERSLPLVCTIRHSPLSSARYRCLSYVWGDPANDIKSEINITYKKTILEHFKAKRRGQDGSGPEPDSKCQNKKMIGSSLAAAFRHLRRKHRRVTIWADALCINQEDADEKSWQIVLMTEIYSRATSVYAWLGPRYDDCPDVIDAVSAAFDLIPTVADLVRKFNGMQRLVDETSWSKACFALAEGKILRDVQQLQGGKQVQLFWATISQKLRDALGSKGLWDRYLWAFEALSRSEYFQRMWILQETGRARSLTFHYGDRKTTYRLLLFSMCLARPFSAFRSGFDDRFLSCLTARMYCNLKCDLANVLELVYWQRPPLHKAKDPRDLIYALLGLATGRPVGIKVDYNLGVEHAYISATRLLLSHGFTDILISFKPYNSPSEVVDSRKFPSWAYDWSTRGDTSFGKYMACGDNNSQPALSSFGDIELQRSGSGASERKEAIVLRGRECGSVLATGEAFSAAAGAAGIAQQVVYAGNTSLQPPATPSRSSPPPEESNRFSKTNHHVSKDQIRREYYRLHGVDIIPNSVAEAEKLFNKSSPALPTIAPFWTWWTKWVMDVWGLIRMQSSRQQGSSDRRAVLDSILELVLHKDPTDSFAERIVTRIRDLHDLIDPHFWSKDILGMTSSIPNTTGTATAATEHAAWTSTPPLQSFDSLMQALFRSAWGTRPLTLDTSPAGGGGGGGVGTGHDVLLGYGPEATEAGDKVVIFDGVKAPLILRGVDGIVPAAYKILGPAYICGGVMQGKLPPSKDACNQPSRGQKYVLV